MLRLAALLTAALAAAAAPATADWLVTRAGDAIETNGEWRVRGALVVFETADGRLRSLRASEVDLEASRERTDAPVGVEPEPQEPVSRGPVRVITDADLERAISPAPPAAASIEDDGDAADPAVAAPSAAGTGATLEVVDWQDRVDVAANVLEITGTAVNRGSSMITDARLTVQLLGTEGDLLESSRASLAKPVLAPGEQTSFTASFPGSPGYASIEFDVKARGFLIAPKPAPADQ